MSLYLALYIYIYNEMMIAASLRHVWPLTSTGAEYTTRIQAFATYTGPCPHPTPRIYNTSIYCTRKDALNWNTIYFYLPMCIPVNDLFISPSKKDKISLWKLSCSILSLSYLYNLYNSLINISILYIHYIYIYQPLFYLHLYLYIYIYICTVYFTLSFRRLVC